MGDRQIIDLPTLAVVSDNDRMFIRTGSTDYQVEPQTVADYILNNSSFSPSSEIKTASFSTSTPDKLNKTYIVDASSGAVTVTFSTLVADDIGKIITVYAYDNTNTITISGLTTNDYTLFDNEIIIAKAEEVSTGVYEWIMIKEKNITQFIYQNDELYTLELPSSYDQFEFNTSKLISKNGVPAVSANYSLIAPDDANVRFANRGVLQSSGTGYMLISYSSGNAFTVRLRVKPTFSYTGINNYYIMDSRCGDGVNADFFRIIYNQASQRYQILVRDDGSNDISLSNAAYTSDVQVRTWTDIILTFDKTNNDDADGKGNARAWINGVELDGTGGTSRTKNGTGISAINITCTTIMFLAQYLTVIDDSWEGYFTDWIFKNSWDTATTNYDGTATMPYAPRSTRVSGIDNLFQIWNTGEGAFNRISVDSINNGAGYEKTLRIPIGVWDMDFSAGVNIPNIASDLVSASQITYQDAWILPNSVSATRSARRLDDFGKVIFDDTSSLIVLARDPGGVFDSIAYNDTTINRGWVIVKYIV